jgi:hypothetical protein
MTVKPIAAAAMLGELCVSWQTATAQDQVRVAQNVECVICAPKSGTAGRCIVQEPRGPCPATSAEDYPKQKFATVQRACAAAKALPECRGGLSGC